MTDHIAVGVIATYEGILAALHRFDDCVGDFCGFHPGTLVEGHLVAGDFHPRFKRFAEFFAAVAVPEIRHVTVLLSLGHGIFVDSAVGKELGQRIFDFRRFDEETLGKFQVSVVLQHSGVKHLGHFSSVKSGEIVVVERHTQFDCAVSAEIEQHHAVSVGHSAHRLAVLDNYERGQILVDDTFVFFPECLYRFRCARKSPARPVNVSVESRFHHIPVGKITVHCYPHSAAAGGDTGVKSRVVQFCARLFQFVDVDECAGGGHIPAVKQRVHADFLYSVRLGSLYESDEVGNVAVHVAVGQQSDKVHNGAVRNTVGGQFAPGRRLEDVAAFNGLFHEFRALRINLSATESVMSHLAVAHIVVGRKSDRGAVRFYVSVGALCEQFVQRGGVCHSDGVAETRFGFADPVHNNKNNLLFHKKPLEAA